MVQEFIIDASVVIQGYIAEPNSHQVILLLANLINPDELKLHIPEFCILECTNILWKQVVFQGITLENMQKALSDLTVTPLTVQPVVHLLPRALAIGAEHRLAVYDSIYLAMSETLKLPLITVDVRQAQAAAKLNIPLKPLSDFPEYQPQ